MQAIDVVELSGFRFGGARHAPELVVEAEVVLNRNGSERLGFAVDLYPFLCLDGLVEAITPTAAGHLSPGVFIHDDDFVFLDDVLHAAVGQRLELNDQRAVSRGVADAIPTFTSQVTLYTRYSQALRFVPGTRNRLSFVLVGVSDGLDPVEVAERIEAQTGLKAETREEFARAGVNFIIQNTGIPTNFGITVVLGFVVGVAIVGLTFSLFIRDNIRQFGALKAIGVTNGKIVRMVGAQAGMVGAIGYALGVLGTVAFLSAFSGNPFFKGFYIPWQIPLISLVSVIIILAITGWLALRSVLRTEPASVFR